MAEGKRYSHIEVGGADDDEVVIQTGAAHAAKQSAQAFERELDEAAPATEHARAAGEAADGDAEAFEHAEPESEDAGEDASELADAEDAEDAEDAPVEQAPVYRETTKEDLDSVAPMSLTQKVVIGCVAVFIVAFVVYYVFLF